MKVRDVHIDYQVKTLRISKAFYREDYVISVVFNDGKMQDVNFKTFLEGSEHPEIRKYLNPALFKQFKIVNGNLNWNGYELIFPIAELYEGQISVNAH